MVDCLNTYSSIENIKRDDKDVSELSESHTKINLGVAMRGKESLVVTDSCIVLFWDKEVNKNSLYYSEGSKSNPIFSNRTLSDCLVHGVDFSKEDQRNMQEGAITWSTKEEKKDEINISPQECHTVQNILNTYVILYG